MHAVRERKKGKKEKKEMPRAHDGPCEHHPPIMSPARYLFTLYHSSRRSLGTASCMRAPTYLLTLARCARNPFVHCPTSLQTRPSAQKIDRQEQRKKKKKKKDGGRTGSYLRTRFPPCLARTRDRNANLTTSHETPKLGATRRSGAQPMRLMPWG